MTDPTTDTAARGGRAWDVVRVASALSRVPISELPGK